MDLYNEGQAREQRQLTDKENEFIKNGEQRAIQKYVHFNPTFLFIEDVHYNNVIAQIKRVIAMHAKSATFNPRFLEIYVETVLFCQIVRRYNEDVLLSDEKLNEILDWLSDIVNSFVHF